MIPDNILKEHIEQAIAYINENGMPHYRRSTRYALRYGEKFYPPRYVIFIANRYANGIELNPILICGGDEVNKYLEQLGFQIVLINEQVETVSDLRKTYAERRKNYSMPTFHDAPIVEIFGDMPRISYFMYKCESEGKTMLSQITDSDIDGASKIRGVGIKTAIKISKRYAEYRKIHSMPTLDLPELMQQLSMDHYKQTSLFDDFITTHDAPIVEIFGDIPRIASFVYKCESEGKTMVSQITDSDIDEALKLKGLGIKTANDLRKRYAECRNNNSMSTLALPDQKQKLSTRAVNCLEKLGVTTLEDLLSLTPNYLKGKCNIGAKTCQEIINYCESASKSAEGIFKAVNKNYIASDNLNIPIQLLSYIGIEQLAIDALKLKGIHKVGDIFGKDLSPPEFLAFNVINEILQVSVIDNFAMKIGSLNEKYKECMVQRCQGATLQSIGNEIGVTRERVRQIIVKNTCKLVTDADMVAGILLTTSNNSFGASELQEIFSLEQVALCCKLVLKKSSFVNHIESTDTFILNE